MGKLIDFAPERQALLTKLLPPVETKQAPETEEVLQGVIVQNGPRPYRQDYEDWIPEHLIDDNPFQPRGTIHKHDPAMIALMRSLDAQGQLQSVLIRPHPTIPGRFQSIVGHRRKYAVRFGANARGASKPDAAEYKGKVRCHISFAAWTDLELVAAAMTENIERNDLNVLEQAKGFDQAFQMVRAESGKKKMDAWADVSNIFGLSYQHMTRMAYVLELPAEWQKKFGSDADGHNPDQDADEFVLTGTHVRALYTLRDFKAEQAVLWTTINKEHWMGTRALKVAEDWQRDLKSKQLRLSNNGTSKTAKVSARTTGRSNRASIAAGTAKLKRIAGGDTDTPNEEPTPEPTAPALPAAAVDGAAATTPESPDQILIEETGPFDSNLPVLAERSRDFRKLDVHFGVAEPHLFYVSQMIAGGFVADLTPVERAEMRNKLRALRDRVDEAEAALDTANIAPNADENQSEVE
jgi:ParB-like chromosome segregation protein Spo0J